MLTEILHRVAARPRVYDAIQAAAGSAGVNRRLQAIMAELPAAHRLLDLGGGTGLERGLWPDAVTYLCLDIDRLKLSGFIRKHPDGTPLVGDATRLPLLDETIDLVLCKSVSHHIDDGALPRLFSESARVLRPNGHLVFVDAVWDQTHRRGRIMWRYDRGSHPRPAGALREAMARSFAISHWEEFAIHHRYVLGVGRR